MVSTVKFNNNSQITPLPFIGNCKRARYVTVIAFVYLENNKIHPANQINPAGNTLLTNSHEIIYPLRQRASNKPYPVQRHIPIVYRLYKGVPSNPGEKPAEMIFRRRISHVLGIPTAPTRGYRFKSLWPWHTTHKLSIVEVSSSLRPGTKGFTREKWIIREF